MFVDAAKSHKKQNIIYRFSPLIELIVTLKMMSGDEHSNYWGVNKDDDIFYRSSVTSGGWISVEGKMSQVFARASKVYGINKAMQIFYKPHFSAAWI